MKKLILYNVLFLILFFTFSEILFRSYLSIKHLKNPHVSYWGKTWYRFYQLNFTKFDENLISVLKEVSHKNVDLPRWKKNSNITVNYKGFRDNNNHSIIFKNKKKILVTGDSFTFGEQVSDEETWPSCLERETKLLVNNGGHPGYSTGQSLRKAIIESSQEDYDYFIWSIFPDDFIRDTKNKIIIKKNNILQFNKFKKIDHIDTKYVKKNIYNYLKELSFIIYIFDREIISKYNKPKKQILFTPTLGKSINYTMQQQINFLISEFEKIQVKNKYILLQYSDQSPNSNKNIINKYNDMADLYFNSLKKLSLNKNIIILDSKEIFMKMPEIEQRLSWFDHHTDYGNLKVCNFILEKIDF